MRCVMWISGGEPFKYILCNICRKFVTPSVSHFCNSIYDTFWENGARRCAAVVQAGKCRHNLGSRRKTENSNKPEVEQLKISSSAEIRTKSKTPEKWLKFLIHSNGIAPTWTISTELHASKGKGRLVTTFVPECNLFLVQIRAPGFHAFMTILEMIACILQKEPLAFKAMQVAGANNLWRWCHLLS